MFRAFSDPYACEIEESAGYAWRVILKREPHRSLASGTSISMEESVKAACVAMAMLKKEGRGAHSDLYPSLLHAGRSKATRLTS
jgi:hypothetical protein